MREVQYDILAISKKGSTWGAWTWGIWDIRLWILDFFSRTGVTGLYTKIRLNSEAVETGLGTVGCGC